MLLPIPASTDDCLVIPKSIARERAPYVSILLGGWGRIAD